MISGSGHTTTPLILLLGEGIQGRFLVMSLRPFLDQAMQISEGLLQKHAQNYNESYSLTQQYAVIHKQM